MGVGAVARDYSLYCNDLMAFVLCYDRYLGLRLFLSKVCSIPAFNRPPSPHNSLSRPHVVLLREIIIFAGVSSFKDLNFLYQFISLEQKLYVNAQFKRRSNDIITLVDNFCPSPLLYPHFADGFCEIVDDELRVLAVGY